MTSANWECGNCHRQNPAGAPLCIYCQASPSVPVLEPSGIKRRYPLWMAVLPGLIFIIYAMLQVSRATRAIGPGPGNPGPEKVLSCVETYDITLNLSEYYVPEWSPGMPASNPSNSPQLSTVLRGMARNGCGENLKNVRIKFVVHGDSGQKGDGSYTIESMAMGEVKPFEKAWMGRVASYEVAAER